jgi:hypothetical protein
MEEKKIASFLSLNMHIADKNIEFSEGENVIVENMQKLNLPVDSNMQRDVT